MKRSSWLLGAVLAAGTALFGQNPGPGPCCALGQVVELKGKVTRVQISPGEGMPFVVIQNGNELSTVYLGSVRYLMMQGFNPKVDEEIVAKLYKAGTNFVAATVTLPAQNKTVQLRDENGRPLWRGGPRRGPMR